MLVETYPLRWEIAPIKPSHGGNKVAADGHVKEGGDRVLTRLQEVQDVAGEGQRGLRGTSTQRQQVGQACAGPGALPRRHSSAPLEVLALVHPLKVHTTPAVSARLRSAVSHLDLRENSHGQYDSILKNLLSSVELLSIIA